MQKKITKVFFNSYNKILLLGISSYPFPMLFVIYVRSLCPCATCVIGLMAVVPER